MDPDFWVVSAINRQTRVIEQMRWDALTPQQQRKETEARERDQAETKRAYVIVFLVIPLIGCALFCVFFAFLLVYKFFIWGSSNPLKFGLAVLIGLAGIAIAVWAFLYLAWIKDKFYRSLWEGARQVREAKGKEEAREKQRRVEVHLQGMMHRAQYYHKQGNKREAKKIVSLALQVATERLGSGNERTLKISQTLKKLG